MTLGLLIIFFFYGWNNDVFYFIVQHQHVNVPFHIHVGR